MGRRKLPKTLEFFILNITVLPAEENTQEYYSKLINKLFRKRRRIEYGNDFYYQITELSKINDGEAFYIVISKFLRKDNIDWVKTENGEVEDYEIPDDLEGRKGVYELLFYPAEHKVAFVKRGKINPETKRKGAPLKAMTNILTIAFEDILDAGKTVHIDIVQSEQIFEKIYSNPVLKLDMTLHYTNPSTNNDHQKIMDSYYRESKIGKIRMSIEPDGNGAIDTEETFVNGSLGIAQENGSVKARIRVDDNIETINTIEHPEIKTAEAENDSNIFMNFILSILSKLKGDQ